MATSKKAKKVNCKTRLRKARPWVATFQGADIVASYAKYFKVDPICAQRDLEAMKASTPEQRKELKQAHDIRKQKEREEKAARFMKKIEKRNIAYDGNKSDPRAILKALKEDRVANPIPKPPKRRCKNCGKVMKKQQFTGLKYCNCGTIQRGRGKAVTAYEIESIFGIENIF